MADTFKTWTDIAADLADNQVRSITAQNLRDALNSFRELGSLLVGAGTTATAALSTAYTTLTQWTNVGNQNGATSNTTLGTITVAAGGTYLVSYSLAFSISSAASEYSFGILKNSDSSPTVGTKQVYKHTSNTAYHPVCMTTTIALAPTDTIKLGVAVDTGTPTITPKEGVLLIARLA